MLFERIVLTSVEIAATPGRKKKVGLIAGLLTQLAADEVAIAARYLSGEVGHKLGVGYATVAELRGKIAPASTASLTILETDRRLAAIAALGGAGSARGRTDRFGELLARATALEQGFLSALVLAAIRQGALDALVVDALALARGLKAAPVRRAYMLAGEIGAVAEAVLAEGAAGLSRFGLTPFRPVLPMLAQTAEDPAGAIASISGPVAFEQKLDGFRVQLHKVDDTVRVYSRALNEVTGDVPELVRSVARATPLPLICAGSVDSVERIETLRDLVRQFRIVFSGVCT